MILSKNLFTQIIYYFKLSIFKNFLKIFLILINCFISIFIIWNPIKEIYKSEKNIEKLIKDNKIKIDNKLKISYYEDNIDFSKYTTNIKIIALYLPFFNSLKFLKKIKKKYKSYNHSKIIELKNNIMNSSLINYILIKKQIKLAISHGIYGFGIYYYWLSGNIILNKALNIIYKSTIKFHFMLIWKNEILTNDNNNILLKEKYEKNNPERFIEDIKKYLLDGRYIRINGKPIIGLYNPKNIPKLNEILPIWRKRAIEFGIGKIFIISALNDINIEELIDMKLFDAAYKSPPNNLFLNNKIKNTRKNYTLYYELFYSNITYNDIIDNFPIYKGIMLKYDNSPITKNATTVEDYSPELFYILNKLLIDQIKNNHNELNNYIFINAWNNYFEGTYLEPDKKYGYSSLNALSKALFNLPYKNIIYNISNLIENCLIAVQVHVFYEDLIDEIINKTNNIHSKFDLYITTDKYRKMEFIKKYIKKNSKANNYKINIIKNKGRDILPFLIQMSDVIKRYKYFCHIHSKKTKSSPIYGKKWRHYLYANLLGTKELVSEILSDFENYNKLGIIFPETFYEAIPATIYVGDSIKYYMNYLINKLFYKIKIGDEYFDFPAGNMFWGRTEAVYQIFKKNIIKDIISHGISNQLLWAIERLWLFINKLNGYNYKKYFKFFY